MSQTQFPVRLKTNIRKLDTDDLASNEFLRYKSTIIRTPILIGSDGPTLTVKEKSVVHHALLCQYVDDENVASKISKSDIISKSRHEDESNGSVRHLVIFTVYEGRDPPPKDLKDVDYKAAFALPGTDNDTDNDATPPTPKFFERASFTPLHVSTGTSTTSRRWLRVHSAETDEPEVAHDSENPIFATKGVRFYLIPMEVTWSTLSLRESVKLNEVVDTTGHARGVTSAQFKSLAGEVSDSNGDPYADRKEDQQSRAFPGVVATTEPTFRVHPGPDDDLLFSTKSQTNVHLDTNLATLADFVTVHCQSFLGSLQSEYGVAMLNSKLRGVHVYLTKSRVHGMQKVVGFKIGTDREISVSERHNAWPSEKSLFLSTSLPLVNLGTLEKPLYLPMETCLVVDGQNLRGPRDLGLSRYISSVSQDIVSRNIPFEGEKASGMIVPHHVPEMRPSDWDSGLVKACNRKFPDILFLEVGSMAVHSQQWHDLRDAFVTCLRQSFKNCSLVDELAMFDNSKPLLSLPHEPGTVPSANWTPRLRDFVALNRKPDRKTVLVVWLESQQDYSMVYKAIKQACDITAGAQTFFVKRSTCEIKNMTAPAYFNIAMHTAEGLRRRICQKNAPPLEKTSNGDDSKLVIAMHIVKVANPAHHKHGHVGQSCDSELYIVTCVSRDITRSERYHTERGIYSKSEMDAYAHVSLLKTFLDLLPTERPYNIMILRSGHRIPKLEHKNLSNCASDLNGSDSLMKEAITPDDAEMIDISTVPPTQGSGVNGEIQAIEALSQNFGPQTLTYVTLTDDPILQTRFEEDGTQRLTKRSEAILFVHGALLTDVEERSIKVQQVQYVRQEGQGQDQSLMYPVIRPGTIMAVFHGGNQLNSKLRSHNSRTPKRMQSRANLSASNMPTPQRRSHTPREPGTPSPFQNLAQRTASGMVSPTTELTQDASEDRSVKSPTLLSAFQSPIQTTPHEEEKVRAKVTPAELDLLTALWKDDDLRLFNTKWPVPTHLAHLAAKRAMVHLCIKESQSSGDNTASVVLPEVHKDVRDTLYYL